MEIPAREPRGNSVSARRIRYVAQMSERGAVRRRFTQTRPTAAVEEPADARAMMQEPPVAEHLDGIDVLVLRRDDDEAAPPVAFDAWLAPAPEDPDAPRAVTVRSRGGRVHWRPGRAVIEGADGVAAELLDAVTEFGHYEGELRRLEREMLAFEARAPEDVLLAVNVRRGHRRHWARLNATLERLCAMRLEFARLKPHLASSARSLPPAGRRVEERLLVRADVPARLEALSERLEACEDLYDGAVDRVNDYRWFLDGNVMEITIIVLLLFEVALMAAQLSVQ